MLRLWNFCRRVFASSFRFSREHRRLSAEGGGDVNGETCDRGIPMKCSLSGCQATPLDQFGKRSGRWYKGEFVDFYVCSSCSYLGFPLPSEGELSDYYSNHYGRASSSWYNIEEDYSERKVLSRAGDVSALLKRYINSQNPVTLEVGCAFGGTVMELRRRGVRAFGADLNQDAIQQGRRRGNEYIRSDFAQDMLAKEGLSANLIYAYHALEHIPNAVGFLKSIKVALADEAVLEFRVPNGAYLKAWRCGFDSWDWFAYPDHLHMFTPSAVMKLAEQAGFEVVDISSSACGESAASVRNWLQVDKKSLPDDLLMNLLERQLLLQELRFVLTVAGSEISKRFEKDVFCAKQRCAESPRIGVLRSFV